MVIAADAARTLLLLPLFALSTHGAPQTSSYLRQPVRAAPIGRASLTPQNRVMRRTLSQNTVKSLARRVDVADEVSTPTRLVDVYHIKRRQGQSSYGLNLEKALPGAVVLGSLMVAQGLQAFADEAVATATDEKKKGWFGSIVSLVESSIVTIDHFLAQRGVQGSTGVAIILLTIIVRTLVLPLNFASLKSNALMQAITPRMKEIQTKYKDDQETQGTLILQLYQKAGINPLAGLVPAFAQIPVFIAFYRALSNLAKSDQLSSPFLWLPSLEGPTFQAQNLDWLTKGWEGFSPPLGWHDTIAYLALPLLYVVGNSLSTKLLTPQQPPNPDGSPAQPSGFTTFLPIMIGYFSLNVPSALILYWVVSNIYSVSSSVISKAILANDPRVIELKELGQAPMVVLDDNEGEEGVAGPVSGSDVQIPEWLKQSQESVTSEVRSDRGARFRALKAKESGMPLPESAENLVASETRGSRFRALKAEEGGKVSSSDE